MRGVIFDMDGTLTKPVLDFDLIRRSLGLEAGRPVLEQMLALAGRVRREKEEALARFEAEAVERSELHPGARELLALLDRRGLRRALLTRNSRRSVEAVCRRHGLRFAFVRTREDGPVKPSPEPVRALARAMGLEPGEVAVVGDFAFDTEAALAAGALAVLFRPDEGPLRRRTRYHCRIRSLAELPAVLEAVRRRNLPPCALPVTEEEAGET